MLKSRFVPTSFFLLLALTLGVLFALPTAPTPADGPKDQRPRKPVDEDKNLRRLDDPPHQKPFKPVQTTERLMHGQDKLFNDLKDAMLDKKWDDARTVAWLLAEMANVNRYQSDNPKYHAFADQMSTDCVELAKILKKRDLGDAKKAASRVGQTCNACHDAFAKKHKKQG